MGGDCRALARDVQAARLHRRGGRIAGAVAVPVSEARVHRPGSVVDVAVLDVERDLLRKRDAVREVIAINADAGNSFILHKAAVQRLPHPPLPEVPARVEIVLGARSVEVGVRAHVHRHEFISLQEAQASRSLHAHRDANELPTAACVQNTVRLARRRCLKVECRPVVERVSLGGTLHPGDRRVYLERLLRLIDEGEAGGLPERHGSGHTTSCQPLPTGNDRKSFARTSFRTDRAGVSTPGRSAYPTGRQAASGETRSIAKLERKRISLMCPPPSSRTAGDFPGSLRTFELLRDAALDYPVAWLAANADRQPRLFEP